jgi:hypothetical protein
LTIHFTHSDLDGVGSLIVNKYLNIKHDKVYILNYPDITNKSGEFIFPNNYELHEDDHILFTDISVNKEFYEYIESIGCKFNIFDHHKDTKEIEHKENVWFDESICGTQIYYDYVMDKRRRPLYLDQLVELINTYDLFLDEHPLWIKAQELNDVFFGMKSFYKKHYESVEFFVEYQLKKNTNGEYYFTEFENTKIENAKEKKAKLLGEAKLVLKKRIDENGNKFGVTMSSSKISYIAKEILEEESLDYIYVINTYRGVNGQVSLRIHKQSELNASEFEGFSGHEKAAGGEFDKNSLIQFYQLDGRKKIS